MQTISLQSVGTQVQIAAATSSNLTMPATVTPGKTLLKLVIWVNSSTVIAALAGWSDWERRSRATNTSIPSTLIAWRVCDGTEGATVNVPHPNAASIGQITAWLGADLSHPLDVPIGENDSTGTTQATAPTITPVTPGVALVHDSGNNANTATSSPPTAPGTFIEDMDGGTNRSGASSHLLNQPASATGAVTATWSLAGSGMAFLIALRPGPDDVPFDGPQRRRINWSRIQPRRRPDPQPPSFDPQVLLPTPEYPRRRLALSAPRHRGTTYIPTAVVVAPHPPPPQVGHRHLLYARSTVRRRIEVIPTPTTSPPPVLAPQVVSRRRIWARLTRHVGAQLVPAPAVAPPPPSLIPQVIRHRNAWPARRRDNITGNLPLDAPPLDRARRRRFTGFGWLPRHRGAQPPLRPVTLAPAFLPQSNRRRRYNAWAPKRTRGTRYITTTPAVVVVPGIMRHADVTTTSMREGAATTTGMRPAAAATTSRMTTASAAATTMRPAPAGTTTMRRP